jgi:hypothetical protein
VFFRNQKKLRKLKIQKELDVAVKDIDALVLAVRHQQYIDLDLDRMVQLVGYPFTVIDCFGILDDRRAKHYFELGCEVKGMGRGHLQRIKDQVRRARYRRLSQLPMDFNA